MTINEFAILHHLQKLDVAPPFNGPADALFPITETDILATEDGTLFIAINRVTGRFAGQRGTSFVSGFADGELRPEQIAELAGQSGEG